MFSSNPRWFMEPDFEENEEEGYDYSYEKFDDDEIYYEENDESIILVCNGSNYIRKIFIGYESEEDYDEDYDF